MKKHWQFVVIMMTVLCSIFAQVKSYGAFEQKILHNTNDIKQLITQISCLNKGVSELNGHLCKLDGYMKGREGGKTWH